MVGSRSPLSAIAAVNEPLRAQAIDLAQSPPTGSPPSAAAPSASTQVSFRLLVVLWVNCSPHLLLLFFPLLACAPSHSPSQASLAMQNSDEYGDPEDYGQDDSLLAHLEEMDDIAADLHVAHGSHDHGSPVRPAQRPAPQRQPQRPPQQPPPSAAAVIAPPPPQRASSGAAAAATAAASAASAASAAPGKRKARVSTIKDLQDEGWWSTGVLQPVTQRPHLLFSWFGTELAWGY